MNMRGNKMKMQIYKTSERHKTLSKLNRFILGILYIIDGVFILTTFGIFTPDLSGIFIVKHIKLIKKRKIQEDGKYSIGELRKFQSEWKNNFSKESWMQPVITNE